MDPTREPVAFLDRVTANVEAQMALDRATQDRHGPAVITVRSRWEADLRDQPLGAPEGWGVSSHTLLRTEAWSVDTSDESADRIEAVLAELPGVVDQGHIHAGEEKDRRPYGWVLRRQTNTNDFCTHTVERWSKETW